MNKNKYYKINLHIIVTIHVVVRIITKVIEHINIKTGHLKKKKKLLSGMQKTVAAKVKFQTFTAALIVA